MRARVWPVAILIALWFLIPYRTLLRVWPWGPDAQDWVHKGRWGFENHWDWVFNQSHFIGYRPMMALSFLANHAVGMAPWIYRATDLGFAAAAVLAAILLYREVTTRPDAPTDSGGWSSWIGAAHLAGLLFALHPVQDEIIGDVARRSYSMSMAFGLLGAQLVVMASRRGAPLSIRAWLGALLLATGLLSNEIAAVLLPVLAMLVVHDAYGEGRGGAAAQAAARALVVPTALMGAAWARRVVVLRDAGGYHQDYVATVAGGTKILKSNAHSTLWSIGERAVEYTAFPVSYRGAPGGGVVGMGWVIAVALTAMALTAAWAWRRRDDPSARIGLVFVLWTGGAVAMCAVSDVWFWRMGYAIALPYAFWIAWLLTSTWRAGGLWRGAAVGLALVLGTPLTRHAAMLHGLDIVPLAGQLRGSAVIRALRTELVELELEGGHVHLALPVVKPVAGDVKRWLERLFPKSHFYIGVVAGRGEGERLGRIVEADGERRFMFGPDAEPDKKWQRAAAGQGFPVRLLGARDHGALFAYPDPDGAWQVERVARRTAVGADEPDMEVEEGEDRDDPQAEGVVAE